MYNRRPLSASARAICIACCAAIALTLIICTAAGSAIGQPASRPSATRDKGVNYATGYGVEQLNCDSQNTAQIARDMAQLRATGVRWVRIETATTAISALSDPPACPQPRAEFQGLRNMLAGIATTGARPIVDILAWHYPQDQTFRAAYKAWLTRLLNAAPDVSVFEIGNEENLRQARAPSDVYPYNWDFHADDFDPHDRAGHCPTDPVKQADVDQAVRSYIDWLADSATIIKDHQPHATVLIGGLSSWQPDCWLDRLGVMGAGRYADAIGYHPYPRNRNTPEDAAATLDDLLIALKRWHRKLPIWITEYGFSTAKGAGYVPDQQRKARYLTQEFALLAPLVAGPVLYYTAHDWPLTTAQWQQQCAWAACSGPVSGSGLFEWRDGKMIEEPAFAAFAALGRTSAGR